MAENPNMTGFDIEGKVVTMPVFMAGFAIDGRTASKGDIRELVENTNRMITEAGHVPPINFGHMFCQPEEPMRGFVQEVRAEIHRDGAGKPLFGLIADVFLYNDTYEAFKSGRFPKVSAEIATSVSTHSGETLGPTLMGVAMLGSSVPAFPQLSAGGYANALQAMQFSVFWDREHDCYKHTDLTFKKGKVRFSNKFSEIALKLFNLLSDNTSPQIQHEVKPMPKDKEKAEEKDAYQEEEGDGSESMSGAEVAGKLREIAGDITSLADMVDDTEPTDEDIAPEGESMMKDSDEGDDKKKTENSGADMTDEQLQKFAEVQAENERLKKELEANKSSAEKALVSEAFNSLQSKGQIAQGQKEAFETLAETMGLDKAIATFATSGGVRTPKNATPLDTDETVAKYGKEYADLGELSEMEDALIKSYRKDGYNDETIAERLLATRKYNKRKGA